MVTTNASFQHSPRAIRSFLAVQNVEYKSELRDPQLGKMILSRSGARFITFMKQRDTYYRIAEGRLKKRESSDEPTEFVFYHRADRVRPKLSHFQIYGEEEAAAKFGPQPLPVWMVIEKEREVWMHDGVHIHVDKVEGLGSFIELQALVTPWQHIGKCQESIAQLRAKLAPALGEAIATGYCD
ncbi:MAG TPA: class IV adenylate cyclase, partial [Phycisphaerales bacterium]|nr:class IV adenylate cyclase [Phycisphaerales bacterium]